MPPPGERAAAPQGVKWAAADRLGPPFRSMWAEKVSLPGWWASSSGGSHLRDWRPHCAVKLLHYSLRSPAHMWYSQSPRCQGGQTGNDHCRTGAQITGLKPERPVSLWTPSTHSHLAVHLDFRAHAFEFIGIKVAVFPRCPQSPDWCPQVAKADRDLRLHICGGNRDKAWSSRWWCMVPVRETNRSSPAPSILKRSISQQQLCGDAVQSLGITFLMSALPKAAHSGQYRCPPRFDPE